MVNDKNTVKKHIVNRKLLLQQKRYNHIIERSKDKKRQKELADTDKQIQDLKKESGKLSSKLSIKCVSKINKHLILSTKIKDIKPNVDVRKTIKKTKQALSLTDEDNADKIIDSYLSQRKQVERDIQKKVNKKNNLNKAYEKMIKKNHSSSKKHKKYKNKNDNSYMDKIINEFISSCVNKKLKHLEQKNALNKIQQKVDRIVKKNHTPVSNKKTSMTHKPKNTKNNAFANFNVISQKTIFPKDNWENDKIPDVHQQSYKQIENFNHNIHEYSFDDKITDDFFTQRMNNDISRVQSEDTSLCNAR